MHEETEAEFLRLIKVHQNIIHKICFIYCRNWEDKKDMHQEIVLQLWKSYPSFKGRSDFSTWMYRVALNTAITVTKRPAIFVPKNEEDDILYEAVELSDRPEDLKLMYRAISSLEKVDRAIILLWLEEKSYEEMADAIGMSVKNISVRLVRIKTRLAEKIKLLSQ